MKNFHSSPVIFQKTDIFAMFEREKVIFEKLILSDFHDNPIWQVCTCIRMIFFLRPLRDFFCPPSGQKNYRLCR